MRNADGSRRKLIIFTEYRDTLAYLQRRIGDFLKRPTLPFNGYAEEVAGLYAGMDLRANF